MAKRWLCAPISCETCGAKVTPEFSQGFWRIPMHSILRSDKPCAAGIAGEKVIDRG